MRRRLAKGGEAAQCFVGAGRWRGGDSISDDVEEHQVAVDLVGGEAAADAA